MSARTTSRRNAPPPDRKGRNRALLIVACLVLAVGVPYACSALRTRKAETQHAKWMEYQAPPHQVVYEEEATAAATLLADPQQGYFTLGEGDQPAASSTEGPVAHFPP